MPFDFNKMHQAILYFANECQNRYFGKTKLMKLLYYLDFDHFERELRPVTGARYLRLQYGPVPEQAEMALRALENSQIISWNRTDSHHRIIPHEDADLSVFDATEREVLQAVAARWKSEPTYAIVNQAHKEAPWRLIGKNKTVPYVYALLRNRDRPDTRLGDQPSGAERERIAAYIRSSQMIEGIEMTDEEIEQAIRIAYSDPVPTLA